MAGGQEHKQPSKASDAAEEPAAAAETEGASAQKEKLDADIDAILDDIDEVLEENAAEFVSSFVQKGGE